MTNFIKNLFKKTPYKFLGRGGISYSDGEHNYYIDTNNFLGKSNNVEIFYKDITLINSKNVLSESKKKEIAKIVKKLLEADGIKSEILPFNYK